MGRASEKPPFGVTETSWDASRLRVTTGHLEAMALYAATDVDRISGIGSAKERVAAIASTADETFDEGRTAGCGVSSPVCYASEADPAYMMSAHGKVTTMSVPTRYCRYVHHAGSLLAGHIPRAW
jgi:hypothetical protein